MYSHDTFLDAARKLLSLCHSGTVTVEMGGVTYIDSSALGTLLVLRDKAEQRGVAVALAHCRPQVRHVLRVAQFDSLFVIVAD